MLHEQGEQAQQGPKGSPVPPIGEIELSHDNFSHHEAYGSGEEAYFRGRPLQRDHQRPFEWRDSKQTKYDGKIPWEAYEVKLQYMSQKYGWDNYTKLAKLFESLKHKVLTFFSGLARDIQGNYALVKKKLNN